MIIQEHVSLAPKTTMRIGGTARYYADLLTKEDAQEAAQFAREHSVPLIVLGGGSNTIFVDGEVEALVVRIKADAVSIHDQRVIIEAGKPLASLIFELAAQGLDLSALTGIPGTLGGAIFGNAGQGPKGVWIDSFVESVTAYIDGEWKMLTKDECGFSYRESAFKSHRSQVTGHSGESSTSDLRPSTIIIWSAQLKIPQGEPEAIKAEVERLLQKRIETQPHRATAGSCFKAVGGTPAWQLIDAVGLRGFQVGGIQVAEKHANFLLNTGSGTYDDAVNLIEAVREKIPEKLEVEMRFIQKDGTLLY